eukprot:Skav229992  [mRNA]  locus=scaffold17:9563:16216:- [translate_table: standard]
MPVTAVALQRSAGKLGRAAVACMQERWGVGMPLHASAAGDAASLTKAFTDCDDALRTALPKGSEARRVSRCLRRWNHSHHCESPGERQSRRRKFAGALVRLTTHPPPGYRTANGSDEAVVATVANLGDSRAILWRKATQSLEVTRDHRPSDPEERARIQAAGGTVSCVPEVYHWTAKRGDWLILGCDGIWDTISALVHGSLRSATHGDGNQQAVDRICKEPGDLGELLESEADDNLTLLAIELGPVEVAGTSTSISTGGFLKAKGDAEVSLGGLAGTHVVK